MDKERWQRLKKVLAIAQAIPASERPAWLERNVREERDRQVLLALVEADEELGQALEEGGQLVGSISESTSLTPGEKVGPYGVGELLAQGGMGAVYRGWDSRLQRPVALKVILDANDPELRRRFERELKGLARVSHPNVLQIFDVVEQRVAVTELLEGRSFREEMVRSSERGASIEMRRAVSWVRDAAKGLAAVHRSELVHRDVKPENLFLTTDGVVKVLDFGIARSNTLSGFRSGITQLGMVIGTPAYCSPEQLRGGTCDRRSDLFSLGLVLWELTTGERVPPRYSVPVLLEEFSRSLERRKERQDLVRSLIRVQERCLAVDPDERFQSAEDLGWALEEILSEGEPPSRDDVKTILMTAFGLAEESRVSRPWVVPSLVASGVVIGALLGTVWRPDAVRPAPRLTFLSTTKGDLAPDLSPDGRLLAFASRRAGRTEIWLRDLVTGSERWLADGHGQPVFDPQEERILYAADAPDGTEGLFSIDLVQARPRELLRDAGGGEWSPDGRTIAFVRGRRGADQDLWDVLLHPVEGREDTLLHSDPGPITYLRWSENGERLWAVAKRSDLGDGDVLLEIDPRSRKTEVLEIPFGDGVLSRPAPGPDGRLLIAHRPSSSAALATSRVVLYEPHKRSLETWFWLPGAVSGVDGNAEEGRWIFDLQTKRQCLQVLEPKEVEIVASVSACRRRTLDRQPVFERRLGGKDMRFVVYTSDRGGNLDLWRLDLRTGRRTRITEHPAEDWDPDVGFEGEPLVWSSKRDGTFEVFVANREGLRPRSITPGRGPAENPTLSADGRWVVYSSGHPEQEGLRRVRIDGSEDQLIPLPREGENVGRAHPEISPDGRWVAFHDRFFSGGTRLRVADVESGDLTPFEVEIRLEERQEEPPVVLGRSRWKPDGSEIAFIGWRNGQPVIEAQAFDPSTETAETRRVLLRTDDGSLPESFDFDNEGKLVVSLLEHTSILVSAETEE